MARQLFAASLLVALAAVAAYAQGGAKTVTIKGYLIDNMCAHEDASEDKDYAEDAAEHSVMCAKMGHCAESGYAVAEGHKLYKLDDAGNKLAKGVLNTTKTKRGMMVEVEGTLDGTTLHATKLTEVAAK